MRETYLFQWCNISQLLEKFCLKRRNLYLRVNHLKQFLTDFLKSIIINLLVTLLNLYNITSFFSSTFNNTDSNSLYPNLSENLMNYGLPGIYRITCLTNEKVYIGESNNVLSRARIHIDSLEKNQIYQMQKDYNLFGRDSFTFHILFIGSEWKNETKRREKKFYYLINLNKFIIFIQVVN